MNTVPHDSSSKTYKSGSETHDTGDMIFSDEPGEEANDAGYVSDGDEVVHLLKDKIKLLENSVADKGKIISLMEARVKKETKEIVPAQGEKQRKK